MPKFEKHIFVCGNQRPPGSPRPCCDPEGRAELQKLFKEKLAARGLKGKVRANQSGCLDQCEHGPNLVVYPDAVWYGRVTPADVDEIIESHILGGKPVERLVLPDSCLNTNCEHRPPKVVLKSSSTGTANRPEIRLRAQCAMNVRHWLPTNAAMRDEPPATPLNSY